MPRQDDAADNDGWQEETEETEETEEEVSLDDFDDDARAKVEKLLARERGAADGRYNQTRAALQQYGLDVADDGAPLIRDPQRVAAWAQPFSGQRPPTPDTRRPTPEPEEEETEIPDPLLDAAGHKRWFAKQVARATDAQTKEVTQLRAMLVRREINDATRRVVDLLPDYGMADLAEHPEFNKMFRDALQSIDPAQWEDEVNLVSVAGMLAPHLKRAERRVPPATNAAAQRQARAGVARSGLSQVTPSRDAGRAPTKGRAEISDFDRMAAERMGLKPEEVESLRDHTGTAYREAKAKAAKR